MDNTETYIKMSERAIDIQMLWTPQEGDWFKADEVRCLSCKWFCQEYKYPEIEFAMTEDIEWNVVDEGSVPVQEITMGRGKFIFKRYRYPIWLPRQDQLQKMLGLKDECPLHVLKYIISKTQHKDSLDKHNYWVDIDSMEQLWLAFVMEEKFNKFWNGEDWIKNDL